MHDRCRAGSALRRPLVAAAVCAAALALLLRTAAAQSAFDCSAYPQLDRRLISAQDRSDIIAAWKPGPGADQGLLTPIFEKYRSTVLATLTAASPGYSAITEDGLGLVFSSVLAYELVAPCLPLATSPNAFNIDWLVRNAGAVGLNCEGYVSLALQIFYAIKPNSTAMITPFGIDRESPIDDHVMIAATGIGVDLLLDPTDSVVAPIGLYQLMNRAPVAPAAIVRFSDRSQPDGTSVFAGWVEAMLTGGTFDYRALVDVYRASPARFTDPDPTQRTRQYGDALQAITWSDLGAPAYWGIFGAASRGTCGKDAKGNSVTSTLQEILPSGLFDTCWTANAAVPVGDAIYFLMPQAAPEQPLLYAARPGAPDFSPVRDGSAPLQAVQIAPDLQNAELWFIDPSGDLWRIDGAGKPDRFSRGGTQAVVGTGDAVFVLGERGQLQQRDIERPAFHPASLPDSGGIRAIWAPYPPRWDFAAGSPLCRSSSDPACRGHVAALAGSGRRSGGLSYRDPVSRSWRTIASDVMTVRLGFRGPTVNFLTASGAVCAYSHFPIWSAVYDGYPNGYPNPERLPADAWDLTALPAFADLGYADSGFFKTIPRFYLGADAAGNHAYDTLSDRYFKSDATACALSDPGRPPQRGDGNSGRMLAPFG